MANISLQPVTVNGRTVTVIGQYSGLQSGDTAFGVTLKYRIAIPLHGAVEGTAAGDSGQIMITSAGHGLISTNRIRVEGVMGTSEANGLWTVDVRTADQFVLRASTFSHLFQPLVQPSAVWELLLDSTEHELAIPANPPPPPANFSRTFQINQEASYIIWAELFWSGSPNIIKSPEVPFSVS